MKYRIAQIFAPKDMGTDGTEVIDVNVVDPISRIMVCFRAQNGAANMDDHPAANLTKIELVDGSDVLYSLTGKEGQALNFHNRGLKPYDYIDNHDDHWNSVAVGLDFGRFLYDPVLGLDPSKFRNLQLKISYDEDVCEADADNNYLEVYAYLFDEKAVSPTGFLLAKEIKSFALADSTYEYIDMDVSLPYRGIFVNTIENGYTWTTHIAELRLSEDQDKRIPIDMDCNRLLYLALEKYGYVFEHCYLDGVATADHAYFMGTDLGHGVLSSYGGNQDADIWTLDGQDFGFIMAATTYSAKGIVMSALPHGSMPILYHDIQDIADWFDKENKGSLQLRVKGGSTISGSATCEIVTEQLRKYA